MNWVKRLNWILGAGVFLSGVVFLVIWALPGESFHKFWSYLATLGLALTPIILRKILHFKISDELVLGYYCFIIPAMVLGIDLDFYKPGPYYDKIVHFFSGVLAVFAARELMYNFKMQTKTQRSTRWFQVLLAVGFAALTAVLWECFEFTCDQFFGQHMQELISEGVADTMYDLISATVGAILASLLLFIPKRETARKKS